MCKNYMANKRIVQALNKWPVETKKSYKKRRAYLKGGRVHGETTSVQQKFICPFHRT